MEETIPYEGGTYFIYLALILFVSLIVTISYSWQKGGLREICENLLLWLLLSAALMKLFYPPVTNEDETEAALYFIAFGVCRIAKYYVYRLKIYNPQ